MSIQITAELRANAKFCTHFIGKNYSKTWIDLPKSDCIHDKKKKWISCFFGMCSIFNSCFSDINSNNKTTTIDPGRFCTSAIK